MAEQVRKLKKQPGSNIAISGSGTLVQSLLQTGLIDELNLLVYPVVLGRGKRLFKDGANLTLKLKHSKISQSGVLLLTYQLD
jgi:dihydrofolate reductase